MKPAVQDAEGRVVFASDDDQFGSRGRCVRCTSRTAGASRPAPSLCSGRGRRAPATCPAAAPRLDVPPPVLTIDLAAVALAHRVYVLLNPAEWFCVQRGIAVRHVPTEIDDPLACGSAREIHAVHPRLQDVGIDLPVRVGRNSKPFAREFTRGVEGATLRIAHEGGTAFSGRRRTPVISMRAPPRRAIRSV